MSDSTLRAWPEFAARVKARLEAGARAYPESPSRSELELLDEIAQELEDVAGWSCVLWSKLEAIKARLGNTGSGGPPAPDRNGSVSAAAVRAVVSGRTRRLTRAAAQLRAPGWQQAKG